MHGQDAQHNNRSDTLAMRSYKSLVMILALLPFAARSADGVKAPLDSAPVDSAPAGERLGVVSFPVSCLPQEQAAFNRGVALLHDFWYEEARPQFERILKADPSCAMAHWGVALSGFHQIWDHPSQAGMDAGWQEMQAAQAKPAKTARERAYIAALADFFQPGAAGFQPRIEAYAAAMGKLYGRYPGDVDAGAFYALALLAEEAPGDTTLTQQHRAMAVLNPLFAKFPDNPGVVHYITHACDTPSMASDGLAAARHYGVIAPSGPHAVHMPGHIFSRLGLWQEDIDSNLKSVTASRVAEQHHESGEMDQFHSDDFLVYAYLQSGQEGRARAIAADAAATIHHFESMPEMAPDHYMVGMYPYYRLKLPIFIDLETRDWTSALALTADPMAPPETQTQVYWARVIAAGHLCNATAAQNAVTAYETLLDAIRKGDHAYYAQGTATQVRSGEMQAWLAYAKGDPAAAGRQMRVAADLQDKVGQGEVDIPAREMLADMLLDDGQPKEALAEYQAALKLSPNRFNGLYGAGRAAEASGDKLAALNYYRALMKSTDDGAHSSRPEYAKIKASISSLN
jgi:tetratricopeptide (TPR) repeat protein